MDLKISLALAKDAYEITELLNETTLFLHNNNINQWKYPWNKDFIKEEIDKKNVYAVKFENSIIGTFSLKEKNRGNILPQIMEDGLYLYRVAVLPKYQGKNIGIQIMNYLFNYSLSYKKSIYLDCWAGNGKLIKFYTKAGFKLCGEFSEEDYKICIFKYD